MQQASDTRLCRKSPPSARERAVFSPGKDGEAGDIGFIVDGAGCSQAGKEPLEARATFPTEPYIDFGISSWSYPWSVGVAQGPRPKEPLDALALIEKAKALDVNVVQIADNLPLEGLSEAELDTLKRVAQDAGMRIEVGTKGIEPEHMLHFLEIAQTLESPVLRTLPAIFGKRVPIQDVEQQLSQVLDAYQAAGVVIVLENQEAYQADEYAGMMARVNHPQLKVCLDLANALGAMEGPEHVMARLGPHCGNFHFKDVVTIRSRTLMGFTIEGRPAGQGVIPIHWALEQLQQLGKQPPIIIELWPPPQDSLDKTLALEEDWVKESVAFCRTLQWAEPQS